MKNLTTLILIFLYATSYLQAQTSVNIRSLTPEVREQYIQKASEFRKEENYYAAIQQLNIILNQQAKDAPILLFKGDLQLQSKLYKNAVDTYNELLPLNYESTISKINLSYALFMSHQPMKALSFAKMAWEQDTTNTSAVVNYFNAMLWNIKTKEANLFLDQQQHLLTAPQILVLKARLFSTGGDYTQGLAYYDSLATSYPDKNYIKEYSEVLLGKKEIDHAAQTMKSSESLFTENEYNGFKQKLNDTKMQVAGTEFVYFKDVAKNIRVENSIWWQQGEGHKYRLGVRAGVSTITSAQKEKTKAQYGHITIIERWSKAWSGQSDLHLQRIQPAGGNGFLGLTGKQAHPIPAKRSKNGRSFLQCRYFKFHGFITGEKYS